jgi:5-methyltetrahydropteroyltriglutamate--homocysteine methyltransferase
MKRSAGRILTTHAGVLSGPAEFAVIDVQVRTGQAYDQGTYDALRRESVAKTVRRQAELCIDVVSDGELGKSRGYPYYSQRVSGIAQRALRPGEISVSVRRTREREKFQEFYDYLQTIDTRLTVVPGTRMVCNGPLRHLGLGRLHMELQTFREALRDVTVEEAFFPVIAPGWLDHFMFNEYYPDDESFIFAIAEILKPEYQAVVDAGFVLQVDDPGLPDAWPTFFPEPSVEEYRRYAAIRIEALNHALEGIPEDRVRYHVCWGSQHGPHVDDLPLRHIVDLMLKVRAQAYSLEAANVRHEHEWKVWRDVKLPEGKIIIPGVVSHATNVIEHPEVIADRIVRFAKVVGRENVIAGTDCGMGGRVHPQIGWAKLQALTEGAALASKELWCGA